MNLAVGLNAWSVWDSFFERNCGIYGMDALERFVPADVYVGPGMFISDDANKPIEYYRHGRIMNDAEHFKLCFGLHLLELGYFPAGISGYWTIYQHSDSKNRTLWVHLMGMNLLQADGCKGPWADILIHESPPKEIRKDIGHGLNNLGEILDKTLAVA